MRIAGFSYLPELTEIHVDLDEPSCQKECVFDVRDDKGVIDRGGDKHAPDIVVYFVVAAGIRPVAEVTVLRQGDLGFIKAIRMRSLDRMQRVLQDRRDVWKIRRAMVVEYLDQKIAAVKYRPNAESNQVCHGSFFALTGRICNSTRSIN